MLGFSPLSSAALGDDGLSSNPAPIVTGNPVVSDIQVTQNHVISASNLLSGVPFVSSTAMFQVEGFVSGTPSIGTTAVTQEHILLTSDLVTGSPIVEIVTLNGSYRKAVNITANSVNSVYVYEEYKKAV